MSKILVICLGNDSKNLKGSRNDAILVYNFIKNKIKEATKDSKGIHSITNDLFLDPRILFNNDITLDNIKRIISKIQKKENLSNIIIFYSGHGYKNDYIEIYDQFKKPIKKKVFLDEIDIILNYKVNFKFILDSCYSGNFKNLKNYTDYSSKIKNLKLISSCKSNQISNETLYDYKKLITENKINSSYIKNSFIINKKTITLGVFTLNFIKILNKERLKVKNWDKFILDSYWLKLKKIVKQEPVVIW